MLQLPVTFALRHPTPGRDGAVLAVGMTLPDGGAFTVDWRGGRAGAVGLWSSPHVAARAHRAELSWYGQLPAQAGGPAGGPPNGGFWRSAS